MSEFQELPTEKNFGHEFSYASWTAGTRVTLANVPWNSDYRDLTTFDTQAALDNYLDDLAGPVIHTGNMSYAPMNRPVRLEIPHSRVNRFNYLRAYNPAQPIDGGDTGQSFYYFITGVNYVAPNTTELVLQLDVWQTFGRDIEFGNCYIERGHVGIANENRFADYGREFLTTVEGFDVGSEYQVARQYRRDIASARGATQSGFSILVSSAVALDKDPGTGATPGVPAKPIFNTAGGSLMENLPSGTEMYVFPDVDTLTVFLRAYADKPWVTQGIRTITAVPDWEIYAGDIVTQPITIGGASVLKVMLGSLKPKTTALAENWRDDVDLPARYAHLDKFKVYPYMALEMTSYTGTPLLIKPESWNDPHATVQEVPHYIQPGARIMFYPYRYNAGNSSPAITDAMGVINDGGEFLDLACGIYNLPQFSILSDGYLSYMASNVNSIAFQHSSAEWTQQRVTAGAETAFGQAESSIGTSRHIAGQQIRANTSQTTLANETAGWQALKGGATGALTAGTGVGAGMAVAGSAADYAIGVNQRNQSMGISNALTAGVNQSQNQNSAYIADTNLQYAGMAAKGDYQNAIAGINAKVQDAKLIQPTTSGQVGGDSFNLAQYKWGYDVKVKMVQAANMHAIGELWLRYGYAVNRFGKMPAGFLVCEKFTYWKLRETYILSSACPESFKQTIRGIFEKGVTVWANPADIGRIDIADNAPLAGVTL